MIEPTGYTALDLIGFTDKGAYDPTANYVKNDIVSVGNTKWRCKVDDTTGVTPAENANWTIYLESATSLAGMDDVTVTSPKDGDGLVHDGNDWKNIPIMTKEQWKKNGAYNWLPNNGTDKSEGGTVFYVSPTGYQKGVVKAVVQANPSGNASYHFLGTNTARMTLPAGTYKLLGCPSGGGGSKYYIQGFGNHDYTSGAGIYEDGSGVVFTLTQENELYFFISIRSTFTEGGTLYFYPIITTDLNATIADYVPHAMTNRELTPQILYNQNNIYICKQGKIVVAQFSGAKPSDIASLNFASLGAKPVMVTSTFQCRCDAKPTSVELNANGTVANVGYYASYGATYTDLKSDTSKSVYGSICFVSE